MIQTPIVSISVQKFVNELGKNLDQTTICLKPQKWKIIKFVCVARALKLTIRCENGIHARVQN